MFKKIKMLFCNHLYSIETLSSSVRDKNDSLVVDTTYYTCEKCGKKFAVISKIVREKNFYKGLN